MEHINIPNVCLAATGAGVAFAVTPALVTGAIACSKIILVNVIANIAVRILTLNMFSVAVYGLPLVPVPLMCWKISLGCAVVGGSFAALCLTTLGAYTLYEWIKDSRQSRFA